MIKHDSKAIKIHKVWIISPGNGIVISLVIDGFSQLISHTIGLKTQLRQTKTNANLTCWQKLKSQNPILSTKKK